MIPHMVSHHHTISTLHNEFVVVYLFDFDTPLRNTDKSFSIYGNMVHVA